MKKLFKPLTEFIREYWNDAKVETLEEVSNYDEFKKYYLKERSRDNLPKKNKINFKFISEKELIDKKEKQEQKMRDILLHKLDLWLPWFENEINDIKLSKERVIDFMVCRDVYWLEYAKRKFKI